MNRTAIVVVLMLILIGAGYFVKAKTSSPIDQVRQNITAPTNPLQITQMQKKSYPGSDLKIEQTLADGSNYHRFIFLKVWRPD